MSFGVHGQSVHMKGVVTLWMASFRGAINRACPWAVDLSYKSSLERQRTGRKRIRARGGKEMSANARCVFVDNLKV